MAILVVTGPPGCGKSTWVRATAQPGDIRFDSDALTNLLSGRDEDKHHHDKTVKKISTAAREAGIREALRHRHTLDVYILTSNLGRDDERKFRHLGAQFIIIDPGYDVALARCRASRPGYKHRLVDKWYERRDQWPSDARIISGNTTDHDEVEVPDDMSMPRERVKSPAERGLGHRHDVTRRRLLFNHRDGEPCWWCARPMFKDPERNFDGAALEADHSRSRSKHGIAGNDADRLMHRRCNRSRGDGSRDHERPAMVEPPAAGAAGAKPGFEW